jgi:hypothetical protein
MIKKQVINIKHNRLKKIVDNFNEIRSWLDKHRNILRILKKDHELLTGESPFKIHFAVDFHEIYQIVFPMVKMKEKKKIRDSEKDDWIRQKAISQSGRICLFYGIETLPVPVLLPPYRDELEDFLFWLKAGYEKAAQQYHLLLELKNSIQTALHKEGIEFIGKGKYFKVSNKNYSKIIRFIKEYFLQLSILLGGHTEALAIIKSLFSDDKIEMVSDRWSEYIGLIDKEIEKVPIAWYEFVRSFREENQQYDQSRERDVKKANERDIKALHLINTLNNKFKLENKKEIVLLVSDAGIFSSLLNSKLSDDKEKKTIGGVFKTATGEKIEILRNTDLFHTYLLIKKDREELKAKYEKYEKEFTTNPNTRINRVTLINVEDDLRKIKIIEEFEKEINRIIKFCNQNRDDCKKSGGCTKKDICDKADKVIKDFQEDRKSFESLALADKFDIYTKIYKQYQQIAKIDEGAKRILKILQSDEKICEKINEQIKDIREHINQGFEKLTLNSIYTMKSEPNVIKIPRGNSFRIKTFKKDIDEIIGEIQKCIRQNDQASFSHYFSDLKEKRKQLDKTESLEYLLSSLISAAYEKYDLALYFLKTALIFEGLKSPLYIELKYLETIIYCNSKKYEKALSFCRELLVNYKNDCRFPYFCGYIILTGKDDNALDGCSFEEAVKYCRKSLSIIRRTGYDDVDLYQALINNLIYGLSKIGTSEAIEEAEQNKIKLERFSNPEYDWGVDIWHTVGYMFFRKVELMKEKHEDYSNIIDKAIENFKTADNKALGKNQIIKDDLEKAIELKNSCPTS